MTTTVQHYLDKGLRGLWYPVLASWEVQSAPVGITRLGEQIVVWRNKDGQVQALEDRCPHRGARLSMGWNLGDRIACWYHGVEVAGNGEVKDVPAVDKCPLVGQQCVRSYNVQEAHGAIFLWFGVTADQQPDELTFPDELADTDSFSNFLCTAAWKCNYQYALENVMDPMHGTYLHSSSHSMAEGDRKADMVLQPTKTGFIFEKKGQSGVNFDWVELGNSGTCWMRLSIPYKKRFGPGGHFFIVGMVVPEDNDNCRVFFWRIRRVQGWQRDMWRFMYRNRLEKLHWEVLEQDRVVLESTLRYMTVVNDVIRKTGVSNIKGTYLVWNMVDGREKSELYEVYEQVIAELGLHVLKTFIPDSKRFRRELSAGHRPLFRSTLFPADRSLLRGSNIEALTDEVLTLLNLRDNG